MVKVLIAAAVSVVLVFSGVTPQPSEVRADGSPGVVLHVDTPIVHTDGNNPVDH